MSTFRMRYDKFRLSNRFIFGLLIAVAVSAYALSSGRTRDISQEGNAYNENANATTNEEGKLDLVVSVDNRRWKIGDPFLAKLRVHNPGKVPVQGICSFALTDPLAVDNPYKEGRNLWAPVIVQEGGVQPAPGPVASVLKPGQTIELEVDLNKLNWASVISNLWPANPISRSGYEAGDYDFSFRIHVTTQETAEKMESNRIKVSIK